MIDEIIVFHPIAREQMRDIVNIQLDRLRQRLSERHITLQLTSTARDRLAEMGYDEEFGARPLKRVMQRESENRIARKLLDGTVRDGDTVIIDVQDGKFTREAVRVEVPEEVHARRERVSVWLRATQEGGETLENGTPAWPFCGAGARQYFKSIGLGNTDYDVSSALEELDAKTPFDVLAIYIATSGTK